VKELWVKNDAVSHPSLSFKDRVVSVAVSKAIELDIKIVACASTETWRTPPPRRRRRPDCPRWS